MSASLALILALQGNRHDDVIQVSQTLRCKAWLTLNAKDSVRLSGCRGGDLWVGPRTRRRPAWQAHCRYRPRRPGERRLGAQLWIRNGYRAAARSVLAASDALARRLGRDRA